MHLRALIISRGETASLTIGQSAHTNEHSPVTATVDLAAIRHNARVLQDRADGADLMAVVKANAYGHGELRVAQTLHEEGVRHFGVARLDEGIRLREHRIADRILVLGAPSPEHILQYVEHDLDLTISSPRTATAVARRTSVDAPVRAHVKVDTGMGRLGLAPDDVPAVVSLLADTSGVDLVGLWTHFATADVPESAFAQTQLERFEAVVDELEIPIEHVHAANTGAVLTLGARTRSFADPLVRSGIALYGLTATPELGRRLDLRPAMQLDARVTQLKTVPAGTPISYGARWRASQRTRIATLGAGYGDGYPRLCSGRASVQIGESLHPVVGTICMDMCMVNLGLPGQAPAATVEVGDEAVLFGPSSPSVYDVARWAETIPYEICCRISPRVPRRYVEADGETTLMSRAARSSPPGR